MANNRQKKVFNLFIAFSIIVICSVIFAAPILSQLIQRQLEFYLKQVDSVDVRFDDIRVKILPPKVSISNVVIVGKKDTALSSFKTDKIEIMPRISPGFLGHVNIKQVKIIEPYIELRQIESKQKKEDKKLSFQLPQLQDLVSVMIEDIDWGKAIISMQVKNKKISCILFDSDSSFLLSRKEDVLKLKSKAQFNIDGQAMDIDFINFSLNRSGQKVRLASLNILSDIISIQADGALMPAPKINFMGTLDLHQFLEAFNNFNEQENQNDLFGKLNYKGSLENTWQQPLVKAELNSSSVDIWQRNITSFYASIEATNSKISSIDTQFSLGKGSVKLQAKNVSQSDQGTATLKVNHLPIETFIKSIDPETSSPLEGTLDIESKGFISLDPSKMKMDTRIVSKQLKITLEPEVERFAPLTFKNIELLSVLKSRQDSILNIEEGDLNVDGLKGKFSLDIHQGGGVTGKWLGEVQDFSKVFVSPYPVKGSGQFLGGVKASNANFVANVGVDIDAFSYKGSEQAKLSGNIIFKNQEVSFQDITIKNPQSVLTAQIETSSIDQKNNFVKASFENFDLSSITKVAGRAYPFVEAVNGRGDGQIYVKIEDKVNGRLKLNASQLSYKGLNFKNAVMDVLIKDNKYIFNESEFDGGESKLLVSGEVTEEKFNNLDIKASNLDVGSLNLPEWADIYFNTLSGYVRFNGDIKNPKIESELECTAEKDQLDGLSGYTCKAMFNGPLNDLNWQMVVGENKLVSQGKFYLNTKKVEVSAELNDFVVLPFYKTLPTVISANINLSGKVDDLSSMYGNLQVNQIIMQRQTEKIYNQKPFSIDIKQGIVNIPLTHFVDNKKTDLEFYGQMSPSLVNINLAGNVDLQNLLILDIGLERSEGIGKVNLAMTGKPDAINYQGSVTAEQAFIKLEAFPHPFERLNLNGELQQNVLFVNELNCKLGGGDLGLFGEVNIQPKVLNSIVNLQGRGERINLRFPTWLPVELSGSVFLKGPMSAPTLGGDFTVLNGQYEDKWDWQSRVLTFGAQKYIDRVYYDEDISMYFDMNFKTTANTFRLKNNIAQGLLTGEVRLIGNNQKLGLLGSIEITNGEVEFLDNIFELENGAITFTNQNDINPKFDLRATTSVSQKKIILDITSEGDEIVALLSSDPYLDETSIVTLLTVGVEADEFLNSESQANRLSSSFLPSVLSSPIQSKLEKGLRDVNVVDTLQFIPYFSEEQQSTGLRVLIGKKIFPRFRILYSTDLLQTNAERNLRLQQNFSRNLSIQGNIRDNNNTISNDEQMDFGLDFEFRFDF
ncbi:MAG TPA: translocation/assembly module TamB domain-containing protein [Oligoflexia bacterium]|nr:translocation/assembly module TamB domain-containing protein [Oligoflexia bacterium]HMR25718.1 translocation/assembly module TamB domain-containing protein [Oligoflexia bacterium]